MPTATKFFGYSAHNLGPLTTTYTAPSSCATSNDDHILYANATSPYLNYVMASSCSAKPFGDCYPSGKQWDSAGERITKGYQGTYQYFSPGIACPKGWETVGTLKHGSKSGGIDVSGALTMSATWVSEAFSRPTPLQATDFWANVLDKSETLAYCCPSGYAGDIHGFCKSSIGPLEPTNSNDPLPKYCMVYATNGDNQFTVTDLDGVTYTNGVLSLAPLTTGLSTTTRVVAPWGDEALEGLAYATWVPAVTLIYKKEDVDGKAEESGKRDDAKGSEDKEDDESVAPSIRRGGVVSVLGVAMGILVGAGMMMPW